MSLGVGALVLIFLFWGYSSHLSGTTEEMKSEQDQFAKNHSTATSESLNPPIERVRTITYMLTRRDLLANQTAALVHNRVVQVFAILGMVLVAGLVIMARPDSVLLTLAVVSAVVAAWIGVLLFAIGLTVMATVFLLKHRGVLGEHVLEITERGLLEKTDYGETLAKWHSIYRIRSTRWFLYIYLNELQFHPVPKRYFSKEQIIGFESELRVHAKKRKLKSPANHDEAAR